MRGLLLVYLKFVTLPKNYSSSIRLHYGRNEEYLSRLRQDGRPLCPRGLTRAAWRDALVYRPKRIGKDNAGFGFRAPTPTTGAPLPSARWRQFRTGLNSNLGFSAEDRRENIRRIAEVGKLFVDTGIITIAAFISPTQAVRAMAEEIIGAEHFKEVYISTPLEVCEARDVKGLYASARRGEIPNFTGISAPFEAPLHPALSLDTSRLDFSTCLQRLLDLACPPTAGPENNNKDA